MIEGGVFVHRPLKAGVELQESISSFLQEFVGDEPLSPERALVIWHGPRLPFTKSISLDAAVNAALSPPAPGNVYFAPCRMDVRGLAQNQRGSTDHVTEVPGVWLDIDFDDGDAHSKGALPPSMDDALRVVDLMPTVPTAIVQSGHGLHAYWLWNEPVVIQSDEDRNSAELLSFRWNQLARSICDRLGWAIDSTFDLARVLRVPGTFNHKTSPPVECRLIEDRTDWRRRYEPSDLGEYLVNIPDTRKRATAARVATENLGATLSIDYQLAKTKLEPMIEALKTHQGFRTIWERKQGKRDDVAGASEWDYRFAMSVVSHLRNSGTVSAWSDLELLQLLSIYRQNQPADSKPDKAFDVRYLSLTLEKARLSVFENDEQQRAHVEAEATAIARERDIAASAAIVEKKERQIRAAVEEGDIDKAKDIQESVREEVVLAQRRTIDIVLDSLLSSRETDCDLNRIEIIRTTGGVADKLAMEWMIDGTREVVRRPLSLIDSRRSDVCRTLRARGVPIRDDYISPPRPWNPALMKWPEIVTALCSVAIAPPIGEIGAPDEEDRVVEQMLLDYFRLTVGGSRLDLNLSANEGASLRDLDSSVLIGGAGIEEKVRRATMTNAFRHGLPAYAYSDGPAAQGVYQGVSISLGIATQVMQDRIDREDNETRFGSPTMRSKAIREWLVRRGWLDNVRSSLSRLSVSPSGSNDDRQRTKRLILPREAIERICQRDESDILERVLMPGDRQ